MDSSQIGLYLIILLVLGGAVILANVADKRPSLRPVIVLVLVIFNVIYAFIYASLSYSSSPTIQHNAAPLVSALAIGFAGVATLLLLAPVRRLLVPLFPRHSDGLDGLPTGGFDPQSMVHMAALVICVYFLGDRLMEYFLAGGLAGLAQDTTTPTPPELLTEMALFIGFAVLGVGFGIRRQLSGVLRRLGLQLPTVLEIAAGAALAVFMICVVFAFSTIWELLTSPDILRQQTAVSEMLSSGITTLSMGFLLSATSSIGEEIAFRGALQPIFGLWPTTIFFALAHIQYTLTPATLIIVILGVGLGLLRRRYNTTSSIVAHFLYNFISVALSIFARVAVNFSGFI